MAEYDQYLKEKNLTYPDVVAVIAPKYRGFAKNIFSMCVNGDRYAVALLPAAEDLLVEKYGPGPGLSISPKLRRREAIRRHNKLRPNQLCVRLNDNMYSRMRELSSRMGFATNQDFLEAAVAEFLARHETP